MSDLLMVKNVAKDLFFAVPLEGHPKFGPVVVSHPFTDTGFIMLPEESSIINLLDDKKGFARWKNWLFHKIDNAASELQLMHYLTKPWKLTFLKYAKPYLDNDAFSELLGNTWVVSENPNMDVNCTRKEMIGWFKKANKKKVMEKEEYSVWEALPERFEVYRGVAEGRRELGLSWTRSLETAEWFANRFSEESFILKATIDKKHALAYFNGRDEDEIVVDVFAIKKDIEKL